MEYNKFNNYGLFIFYIPKSKKNYGDQMNSEQLMLYLWEKYLVTKDIKYLAEACEKAPFFGQKKMGEEIGKILRNIK